MKNLLIVATSALCVLLAVAVPLPEQDVQIVQIPLEGDKELDILSLPENNEGQLTERNKRTIGVLRQLFPELSKKVEQVIEEKIQLILPIIFRNVGPLLLRSGGIGGLLGGGGGTSTTNDDDDDFDDDDNSDTNVANSDGGTTSTRTGAGGRKVSISLPTFPPDTDDEDEEDTQSTNTNNDDKDKDEDNDVQSKDEPSTTAKSTDTTQMTSNGNGDVDLAALSERLDSINRVVRNTASQTKEQPAVAESKSDKGDTNTIATAIKDDAEASPSEVTESKSPALDELTLEDDDQKDEDRNKRFLSFGFGGSGSNGSGGSGNFLFDIIRRTADRAARAAGTIYRVAAGTESFDLNNNKQATRSTDDDTDFDHNNNDDNDSASRKLSAGNDNGLVGGSAGTEQTDERENAPEGEATVAKNADGYTEGIPGPVTRLFVLANRGLANLIQDLILRIAQTSERVVNFKARLITSLI